MAPDWEHMYAVMDAEIAYWARQLVLGEISAVLNDLHPRLQLDHATIRLNKTGQQNYDLAGNSVLLVPEIFAGPHLLFDPGSLGLPVIGYALRGLGMVWENNGASPPGDDALSALMGKGRTAILRRTQLPATTTDLARELGLSGATVSVHLATLKRCGMDTSWRSGRRVLYQRTALASSILSAAAPPPAPPCITPGSARSPAHPGLPAQASIVAGRRAVIYRHIRVVGRLAAPWLWPNASRPTVFLCSDARGVNVLICRRPSGPQQSSRSPGTSPAPWKIC